jgi:hypothetical protein
VIDPLKPAHTILQFAYRIGVPWDGGDSVWDGGESIWDEALQVNAFGERG